MLGNDEDVVKREQARVVPIGRAGSGLQKKKACTWTGGSMPLF